MPRGSSDPEGGTRADPLLDRGDRNAPRREHTLPAARTEEGVGIKGATASAQTKPATCETGFVITVPSFINPGDVVRINTETGEYQGRA